MYNVEVASLHYWWGKFSLAFYHLHDIPTKFENNRFSIFRQSDKQRETGDLLLRTLGVMKGRENVKVESRPMESITKTEKS